MKKTIKELEIELEHAQKSRDDYYRNWQELERKKEKEERDKVFRLDEDIKQLTNLVDTLREIIRWQINPETAKYPFRDEKSQRGESTTFN